jgi:hypothetical protein
MIEGMERLYARPWLIVFGPQKLIVDHQLSSFGMYQYRQAIVRI